LADAICEILTYPSLSTSLCENSKEELQDITWAKAAKKVKAIYETELRK
jgi:hypothetical protein